MLNGVSEQEKFHAAARNAILMRTWGVNAPTQIYDLRTGGMMTFPTTSSGQDYGLQSPHQIIRRCLIQAGMPHERAAQLAAIDLANIALGQNSGFMLSDGPAYNVSGMFSNILFDASNVLLRKSYDDARVTFPLYTKRLPSLINFREAHAAIAGEVSDPRAIPENGQFEEVTLTDGKEKFKLVVWGEMFSYTWQLIVNDQLGAFTEIDVKMGKAMKRKQNRLVSEHIKANGNMSDGGAFFNGSAITTPGGHNNLTTGAISDYGSAFSTMNRKMKSQRGLDPSNSGTLNIPGQFIVYPSALNDVVRKQLGSTADPSASNSGVMNPYQGAFTPIEEEEYGASSGGSDTALYLFADPAELDSVGYCYLQGLETPRIEQSVRFDRLAIRKRIYQAFAVKTLDHRGAQKHVGT